MNKFEVRSNAELIYPTFLRMSPKSGFRRKSNGHKENTQYKERKEKPNVFLHTFQLSRFEKEASVFRGQIPSSRFFLKSLVLRYSDFNVRCQMLRCSWPPSSS